MRHNKDLEKQCVLSNPFSFPSPYKLLVQIDDPTPPEQLKCSVNTFIRPLDKFPQNFEKQAKSSSRGAIVPAQNERMLLSSLLSKPTPSSDEYLFKSFE